MGFYLNRDIRDKRENRVCLVLGDTATLVLYSIFTAICLFINIHSCIVFVFALNIHNNMFSVL